MTINDIILRDMRDAERKERERTERETAASAGDECGLPWPATAAWLAVALAALCAAFSAGSAWQARRDLKAQREFHAWLDRVERGAEARARAMGNCELLRAAAERR